MGENGCRPGIDGRREGFFGRLARSLGRLLGVAKRRAAESALLKAVVDDPQSDATRLEYAARLDERGDPRGELIRVQCELAGMEEDDPRAPPLQEREEALLAEHRAEWLGELTALGVDPEGVTLARGMVEEVTLQDFSVFFDRAEALFRAAPALGEIVFQNVVDVVTGVRLDAPRLAGSPYLARLAGLGFYWCGLGAEGAASLARSPHLARLRWLIVFHDTLGDAGAEALVEAQALHHLAGLTLCHCDIGDEGARGLAASPHMAGLEVLNLTGNRIGRKGAMALASSPHLAGLRQLLLAENPLGGPGAIALSCSPFFEHLEALLVSPDQVGEQGRDMLESRFDERVQFVGTGDADPLDVEAPAERSDAGETPDVNQPRRTVRVVEGAFRGMEGEVREVDHDGRRVTVTLNIFGVQTPIDLSFHEVEGLEVQHAEPATAGSGPAGPDLGDRGMNELTKRIQSRWDRKSPATEEQIRRAETQLGVSFPDDYREFLAWSNGGGGIYGEHYVALWAVEEVPTLNGDYQIGKYLPNVIGIGSNRGGDCYALDYRSDTESPPLVQVPFGDLAPESVTILGRRLASWLAQVTA